jgi:hypothetical protein
VDRHQDRLVSLPEPELPPNELLPPVPNDVLPVVPVDPKELPLDVVLPKPLSSEARPAVSRARSTSSRPFSAQVPAELLAFLYHSDARDPILRAWSPITPRSSEPALGASSMPRPAPSTVPVSSPIMKPAPAPSES